MNRRKLTSDAIETGLLTAISIKGQTNRAMTLAERMDFYHVPGFSIALVEDGEVVFARGYGMADLETNQAVNEDTIFQAASISKPVTAILALRLVEEGILTLDQDVNLTLKSWHIPENEHTCQEKVTLRRLLQHSAGITVSGYLGYQDGAELPSRRQILEGEPPAASEPVRVFQTPGQAFCYSGGGYMIIQQLIEDAVGEPLAELSRRFIFEPLKLEHTTFEFPFPVIYHSQAAAAYQADGSPVPGKWHLYPETATAGLWSTPTDLSRLMVEVMKGHDGEPNRLLSMVMTREMLTPQFGFMGLGLVIVELDGIIRIEHPGWNEGYHSYMARWLDQRQGVVWMTNGENGILLGGEVMRGLADCFGWPGYEQRKETAVRLERAETSRYSGRYVCTSYPSAGIDVFSQDRSLFIKETPNGLTLEIFLADRDEFVCQERGSRICFGENAEGIVTSVRVGNEEYKRI